MDGSKDSAEPSGETYPNAGPPDQLTAAASGSTRRVFLARQTEAILAGESPDDRLFARAAEAELVQAHGYTYNAFKIELAKRTIVEALRQATGTV